MGGVGAGFDHWGTSYLYIYRLNFLQMSVLIFLFRL